MSLSAAELIFLVPLTLFCAVTLIRNWNAGPLSVWSPLSLMAVLYLYYTIVGPLYFIATNKTLIVGQEMRPLFWLGWLASLVSYVAIVAGYLSFRGKAVYIGPVCSDRLLERYSLILTCLSFGSMIVYVTLFQSANLFIPVATERIEAGAPLIGDFAFSNYMVILINLSIPAVVLSMLVWLQRRSTYALTMLVIVSLAAVSFFIGSGFRFRIVWLVLGALSAYYLWRKVRPNLLYLGGIAVLFVAAMGLIGMTRNYWAGLSIEKARGASMGEMIDRGFDEAGIFMSIGTAIDAIPERVGYTFLDPLWITVTFPIPRRLWLNKPESLTIRALGESFGGEDAANAGLGMPFFTEWYIALGWPGLVLSSFGFGWLCKRLWVWFLQRRDDKLVILAYTSTLGFLYFVFSRGYTPIMVMNFVFGLMPFFMLYDWLRRKAHHDMLTYSVRRRHLWAGAARIEETRDKR